MTSRSLVEKLVEVATAVRYIEKGGRNDAQHYNYVGEAAVVERVGPELLKRNILAYPQHRVIGDPFTFTTAKGSVQVVTTIESTWVFTDGTDEIRVVTIGQGTDSGDKGAYKAMTGAKKYGLLQALMIATGDDPEIARDDEKDDAPKARTTRNTARKTVAAPEGDRGGISDAQLRGLMARSRDAGMDPTDPDGKAALQKFVADTVNKHSTKDLTSGDIDVLYGALDELKAVLHATNGVVAG